MCEARNGKRVVTLSKTPEMTKFPCKYNAIKDTICGDWQITISPGNMLDPDRNKLYVVKTVWMGVVNVNTKKYWQGRTDLKIARKVSSPQHLFSPKWMKI